MSGDSNDESGKENRAANDPATADAAPGDTAVADAVLIAPADTASKLDATTSAQKLLTTSSPAAQQQLEKEATVAQQHEDVDTASVASPAEHVSGDTKPPADDVADAVDSSTVPVDEKIASDDLAASSDQPSADEPLVVVQGVNEPPLAVHATDETPAAVPLPNEPPAEAQVADVPPRSMHLADEPPSDSRTTTAINVQPAAADSSAVASASTNGSSDESTSASVVAPAVTDATAVTAALDDASDTNSNVSVVASEDAAAIAAELSMDTSLAAADVPDTAQVRVETAPVDMQHREIYAPALSETIDVAIAAPSADAAPAAVALTAAVDTDVVMVSADVADDVQVTTTDAFPVDAAAQSDSAGGEQWFNDNDGDSDFETALIPVHTDELSDDDEPVFLGTSTDVTTPIASVVPKRKRADSDASDATLDLASDTERKSASSSNASNSSSSSSSASSSSSDSSASDSDSDSRSKRTARAPKRKKARNDAAPVALVQPRPPRTPTVRARRTLPPEFADFDSTDRDLPMMRGSYELRRSGRVAVFSGFWGFSDADHAAGGARLSKFEYKASVQPIRRVGDRRPFSGKYKGFFNFRQFSGKVVRVPENDVELHFLKMRDELDESDSSSYEEDEAAQSYAKYEVYGNGENRFGRFLIRGYLNPAARTIAVKRKYLE